MHSVKVGIEIDLDLYEDLLRLLRLVNIEYAYCNSISSDKNLVEFFVRSSDYTDIINSIKKAISAYCEQYDHNFEYKIYQTSDMFDMRNYFKNMINFITSYKDIGIVFEPFIYSPSDIYNNNDSEFEFVSKVRDKRYQYTIPLYGNEFMLSNPKYINSFKLNILSMSLLSGYYSDILILGENKGLYGNIFNDMCDSKMINIIKNYDSSDDYAMHIINNKYSIIFISLDQYRKNIRDIILSGYSSSDLLVIGNVRNCDINYYTKQISEDMNYKVLHSQSYSSFILSKSELNNIDYSEYDIETKNGY